MKIKCNHSQTYHLDILIVITKLRRNDIRFGCANTLQTREYGSPYNLSNSYDKYSSLWNDWPIQAIPHYLRWFSHIQPSTEALRSLFNRGSSIDRKNV
jgi:hypothetical protein